MLNNIQLSQCNFVININSQIRDITQSQNSNIISNSKNVSKVNQNQNSNSLESEYLKKEIEFLKIQLEFSQNLIEKLLTGKGGVNA